MKTILTMPSPELALLTMTGEGKPFVLNRRTMAELEALLEEVIRGRLPNEKTELLAFAAGFSAS
mgnify:FL=1